MLSNTTEIWSLLGVAPSSNYHILFFPNHVDMGRRRDYYLATCSVNLARNYTVFGFTNEFTPGNLTCAPLAKSDCKEFNLKRLQESTKKSIIK